MERPLSFFLLGIIVFILLPPPSFTQDPDDIHLLLKAVIKIQQNMVQKLEDIQARLTHQEEQSSTISSTHRSCQESREIMESFWNLILTNECEVNSHNCSEYATCNDRLVHYDCTCLPGYSGDGFTCLDVDECRESTIVCGEWQTCTNTPGSYFCTCQDGFQMENDTCKDKGPYCELPFKLIPDVGCLYFETEGMPWEEARDNCEVSFESKLYEPENTKEFMSLINYLNDTAEVGSAEFIWVGVKGEKWIYNGEVVSGELWREGDPDEGSEGYGYLRKASSYKLGDFSLARIWPSICKLQKRRAIK